MRYCSKTLYKNVLISVPTCFSSSEGIFLFSRSHRHTQKIAHAKKRALYYLSGSHLSHCHPTQTHERLKPRVFIHLLKRAACTDCSTRQHLKYTVRLLGRAKLAPGTWLVLLATSPARPMLSLSCSRSPCTPTHRHMLPCGLCQPSILDLSVSWPRFEARCATQILRVKSAEQLARMGLDGPNAIKLSTFGGASEGSRAALWGPRGRSSALEPRGPPYAGARVPRAAGGRPRRRPHGAFAHAAVLVRVEVRRVDAVSVTLEPLDKLARAGPGW